MPSRARRCGGKAVMSRPFRAMRPVSGGSSPASWEMKVVLPAPFGPITACTSPRRTSISISSLAISAPNRLVRPSTARTGSFIGPLPRRLPVAG